MILFSSLFFSLAIAICSVYEIEGAHAAWPHGCATQLKNHCYVRASARFTDYYRQLFCSLKRLNWQFIFVIAEKTATFFNLQFRQKKKNCERTEKKRHEKNWRRFCLFTNWKFNWNDVITIRVRQNVSRKTNWRLNCKVKWTKKKKQTNDTLNENANDDRKKRKPSTHSHEIWNEKTTDVSNE